MLRAASYSQRCIARSSPVSLKQRARRFSEAVGESAELFKPSTEREDVGTLAAT